MDRNGEAGELLRSLLFICFAWALVCLAAYAETAVTGKNTGILAELIVCLFCRIVPVFGRPEERAFFDPRRRLSPYPWATVILVYIVLCAAGLTRAETLSSVICEECAFRVTARYASRTGKRVPIMLLSGLAFGLMHLSGSPSIAVCLSAALFGMLYYLMLYEARTPAAPVITHLAHNLILDILPRAMPYPLASLFEVVLFLIACLAFNAIAGSKGIIANVHPMEV